MNRPNYFIVMLLCGQLLLHTACHRVAIIGTTATTELQPGKKVFVKLIAPHIQEGETQKMIPPITRFLRERRLTVTSMVENLATTQEWRQRSEERLKSFAPDYILELKQGITDIEVYNQKRLIERVRRYDAKLMDTKTGKLVWTATITGRERLLGFYWDKLARKLEEAMVRNALLMKQS